MQNVAEDIIELPARLAQLVERVTSNHEVASSNLAVSIFGVFDEQFHVEFIFFSSPGIVL